MIGSLWALALGNRARWIAGVLSAGMLEWEWTFGVLGSSLRERLTSPLGSPCASLSENRSLLRWDMIGSLSVFAAGARWSAGVLIA
jgi:hypothetical protein